MTVFSPRASWMGHHVATPRHRRPGPNIATISSGVSATCFRRTPCLSVSCRRAPRHRSGSIAELGRCVGADGLHRLQPEPESSGGWKNGLLATATGIRSTRRCSRRAGNDPCQRRLSSGDAHDEFLHLGADTTAFVHFMMSDVFTDFPEIKFIIPHGGGAVPYHWGRFRGMAQFMGLGDLNERVLGSIFFDTCVYHQDGIVLSRSSRPRTFFLPRK